MPPFIKCCFPQFFVSDFNNEVFFLFFYLFFSSVFNNA